MWMLMLEAGMAVFLLVFIVWWTMFSGRKPEQRAKQGQRRDNKDQENNNTPAS